MGNQFSLLNWMIVLIPILLVGGAIFLFGRAIGNRGARERSVPKRSANVRSETIPVSSNAAPVIKSAAPADGPSGFRGWLVLLAIGVVTTPIVTIYKLISSGDFEDATSGGKYQLMAIGDIGLFLTVIILQLYTAFLMARRSRQFTSFYIVSAIATILFTPVEILFVAEGVSLIAKASFGVILPKMLDELHAADNAPQWISTSVGLVIWIVYVIRSRRVANTFVR